MTDFDYEAEIEREEGTFTFRGDDPRVVMAQAAHLPVQMHAAQVQERMDMETPVHRYLEKIAEKQKEMKNDAKPDHID